MGKECWFNHDVGVASHLVFVGIKTGVCVNVRACMSVCACV